MLAFLAFVILLAISILAWVAGKCVIPLVIPSSRLKAIILGIIGGFLADIILGRVFSLGLEIAGINPLYALIGAFLSLFIIGVYPFFKIFLRLS